MPDRKIARFAGLEFSAKQLSVRVTFTESAGSRAGQIRAFALLELAGYPQKLTVFEVTRELRDQLLAELAVVHTGLDVDTDLDPPPPAPVAPIVNAPTFAVPHPAAGPGVGAARADELERELVDDESKLAAELEAVGFPRGTLEGKAAPAPTLEDVDLGETDDRAVPVESGRGGDTEPPPPPAPDEEPPTKSGKKRPR